MKSKSCLKNDHADEISFISCQQESFMFVRLVVVTFILHILFGVDLCVRINQPLNFVMAF